MQLLLSTFCQRKVSYEGLCLPMPFKIFTFALSTQITEDTIVVIPVEVEIYWAILSFLKHCHLWGLYFGCRILERLTKCQNWWSVHLHWVCLVSIFTSFSSSIFSLPFVDMFFLLCVFPGKLNFIKGTTCNWVSLMLEMSGKHSMEQQHLIVSKI